MATEQQGPVLIAHLLVRAGDTLLLLRRAHTGRHDGAWAPPGGRVEAGELPRAAARRECLEETGVAVPLSALVPLAALAFQEQDRAGVNFLFSATLPAPAEIRLDHTIASDACWVRDPPAPAVPWLADALARLRDAEDGAGTAARWYAEHSG